MLYCAKTHQDSPRSNVYNALQQNQSAERRRCGDCPQADPLTTIWQREASLPQIAQDNLGGLGRLLSTC